MPSGDGGKSCLLDPLTLKICFNSASCDSVCSPQPQTRLPGLLLSDRGKNSKAPARTVIWGLCWPLFYLLWRMLCCSVVRPAAFNSPLRAPALMRLMGSRGSPEPETERSTREDILQITFCERIMVTSFGEF